MRVLNNKIGVAWAWQAGNCKSGRLCKVKFKQKAQQHSPNEASLSEAHSVELIVRVFPSLVGSDCEQGDPPEKSAKWLRDIEEHHLL